MKKRFVSIWFRWLKTDWHTRRQPILAGKPLVAHTMQHGRMVITAVNKFAAAQGLHKDMVLADAKALAPDVHTVEDQDNFYENLLQKFAEWFIRYSPIVAVQVPDCIIINASGCAHLWGGEEKYLEHIVERMQEMQYSVQVGMAGTIGAAWAMSHYSNEKIIQNGGEKNALLFLPPASLRIDADIVEKLNKLGLTTNESFLNMPTAVLRRRFGNEFITRIQQALGYVEEHITSVVLPIIYNERLQCAEPIITRAGIEIALHKLLEPLCIHLKSEQKGLRQCIFTIYKTDGKQQQISIGTNRPTAHADYIFHLLELKIETLWPSPGIELFTLEAPITEEHTAAQEEIWDKDSLISNDNLTSFIDKISNKIGEHKVNRFLPAESYWPENSFTRTNNITATTAIQWPVGKIRPLRILLHPEMIMVTAPVPDYPPMLFRHKNKIHKIVKADGPERIEQEWWIQEGLHRDYYYVEDEQGCRYWLFRSGHYGEEAEVKWYLHGYCV